MSQANYFNDEAKVDDYTKEVTEGVYTFDQSRVKKQCKLNDDDMRERRIFKYMALIVSVAGLLIGTLASSSITAVLLQQLEPYQIEIPNVQCTTTEATFSYPGFNQSCSSVCAPGTFLTCQSNLCQCSAAYHWSYTEQMCTPCPPAVSGTWYGALNYCYSMWTSSSVRSWASTAASCAARNATLLDFSNPQSYTFWLGRLNSFSMPKSKVYLNATAIAPNRFVWGDGTPVNPSYFAPGQPNNGGVSGSIVEGCLTQSKLNSNKLTDESCAGDFDWACVYFD